MTNLASSSVELPLSVNRILISQFSETSTKKTNSKDIWEAGEVPEGSEFEDIYDPRPQPE